MIQNVLTPPVVKVLYLSSWHGEVKGNVILCWCYDTLLTAALGYQGQPIYHWYYMYLQWWLMAYNTLPLLPLYFIIEWGCIEMLITLVDMIIDFSAEQNLICLLVVVIIYTKLCNKIARSFISSYICCIKCFEYKTNVIVSILALPFALSVCI